MYVYDANAVLAFPIKNRKAGELLRAYSYLVKYITDRGFSPEAHWLDNEAPNAIKSFDKQHNVTYQLVPPYTHRRNAAERAIRTWKNHFVAGLCGLPTKFPMHLWDKLIPQSVHTLNMLRPCRRNPLMSAFTALEGEFFFNSTPLAPPGC